MTSDATNPGTATDSTGTTNGPAAPAIAKPKEKRPETRVRDALRIVQANPDILTTARSYVGRSDAIEIAERGLEAEEARCRSMLTRARALRDFAREIQGLEGFNVGTLKGGLDSLATTPKT